MPAKIVPPTISSKSFSCPCCGAHASQSWFQLNSKLIKDTPLLINQDWVERAKKRKGDDQLPAEDIAQMERAAIGKLAFLKINDDTRHVVMNLNLSRCYSCGDFAVWLHDKLLHPPTQYEIEANEDLPEEIKADFNEARTILNLSPRGAAALLRLCIQRLCKHLGKSGKDINEDIANLVADGLDLRVQKALDIVRVIGNEAVHPGAIDLRDDRETAAKLFELVNRIAYDTITHPKELAALYGTLPSTKLAAIEARDIPKVQKPRT